MRIPALIILLALSASALLAAPVITSVTPNSGPVAGGTTVVIRGSGFSDICAICDPPTLGGVPPTVTFGGTDSPLVRFIDSTRLEVVTPAHLPFTVPITVRQLDISEPFTLNNAFEFIGEPSDAFEPVLFPIYLPPTVGAFGSLFETTPRVASKGPDRVFLYGEDFSCLTAAPTQPRQFDPVVLEPEGLGKILEVDCSLSTGRILWIPKGTTRSLAANLRVADVTRQGLSHGTEIPVVRQDDFTLEKTMLLGIPTDSRFRSTLRIYSLVPSDDVVNLSINGVGRQVFLTPGRSIFEPSFAVVSDFPRPEDVDPIHFVDRVVIQPTTVPLWGFISVTNNETQQITTITPN